MRPSLSDPLEKVEWRFIEHESRCPLSGPGGYVAEAAPALKAGMTVRATDQLVHAHRTLAEVMREASFKSLDRALHG